MKWSCLHFAVLSYFYEKNMLKPRQLFERLGIEDYSPDLEIGILYKLKRCGYEFTAFGRSDRDLLKKEILQSEDCLLLLTRADGCGHACHIFKKDGKLHHNRTDERFLKTLNEEEKNELFSGYTYPELTEGVIDKFIARTVFAIILKEGWGV